MRDSKVKPPTVAVARNRWGVWRFPVPVRLGSSGSGEGGLNVEGMGQEFTGAAPGMPGKPRFGRFFEGVLI
jgi:hypothetical protein